MPEARIIVLFWDRIANNRKEKEIWKSVWRKSNTKGISVKKETLQYTTFIESDSGHGNPRKGYGTIPVDP